VSLDLQSDAFRQIVDENAEVRQLASDFKFTEGPVWMPDGSLHFSDMIADKRRRWHPSDGVSVVRHPSNKGNGMTLDNDGNVIVCEHVTSSVVREYPDGRRDTLAFHWEGKYLNSPNDVIVASDGSIYFTDPTYGRMRGLGAERAPDLDFKGLYRIAPNGDLHLLRDDFGQPNGLCFSPDESLLYVNDTERSHIRVFAVDKDYEVTNESVFAENVSDSERAGHVDGMKTDELGNVFVTGPGGIWVFSSQGEHIGVIGVPEIVGNLNWGGEEWKTLYIAASTSIYEIHLNVSGNRLGYMRG